MRRDDKDKYLGMSTKRRPSKANSVDVPPRTATQSKERLRELQSTLDLCMSLNKLGDLAIERAQVEGKIAALVVDAVGFGATWAQVGSQLGTSGQAAWSRYRQSCSRANQSHGDETSSEWLERMDELPFT